MSAYLIFLLGILVELCFSFDFPRGVNLSPIITTSQLHNASFDVNLAWNDLIQTSSTSVYVLTRKVFDDTDVASYPIYQVWKKSIASSALAPTLTVTFKKM